MPGVNCDCVGAGDGALGIVDKVDQVLVIAAVTPAVLAFTDACAHDRSPFNLRTDVACASTVRTAEATLLRAIRRRMGTLPLAIRPRIHRR